MTQIGWSKFLFTQSASFELKADDIMQPILTVDRFSNLFIRLYLIFVANVSKRDCDDVNV